MANKTGSNKGRKWISKEESSKMVMAEELPEYLSQGWHLGHDTDHQKKDSKKWYNDGIHSYCIKSGDVVPSNLKPGMAQKETGRYSKYNYTWYTNGVEQKRLSTLKGDTIPDGWYPGFSNSYKEKMSKALLIKGNYHIKNKPYTDEYKELYHNINKLEDFVNNNSDMTLEEMATRFNCPIGSVYSLLNLHDLQKKFSWYNKINPTTSLEKLVIDYLLEIGLNEDEIEQHNRDILNGKELDIYLPKYKLAIECNGTYWHSNLEKGVNKNYHLEKSKLASSKGIRLIHLYEWDILTDKIKSLLKIALNKVDTKIYARQCEIKTISNKEAKPFNELNHLQGHRNAQVTYGLFYKNKLVQLMSFSKTKYNKNLKTDNSWEIIRGCPGSNNIVVGGVKKLFTHFVKDYNPDYVFSYCDFNKFDGRSYEAIGMKFIGYTGPDKIWIVDGQPVKRSPRKYKELKENSECIVWGSGSKKYILEKESVLS